MAKKLKVLILSHSSELAGAERSMVDLFDHWSKKGLVEPYFIIRKPLRNIVPELNNRSWKYYPLYYTNWSQRDPSKRPEDVFRNARYNAEAVGDIEKIINKIKPDLVMTNTIVSPWAAIAAYFQRLPHVWFVREYGDIDHRHEFELGRERMYQDIDSLSDLVVTNSKTLADHVKNYVDKSKLATLYTPFDLDLLERRAEEPGDNPFKYKDSLKLVITGRIAPSKGQDEAAKAVGELNKQGLNAELCIIGTASDEGDSDNLKAAIEKYGIKDKVHLIGHKNNPLSIVKYADLGIMSSQQEAFGRVTFEYMATGRAVVGANAGATPELIKDGVNGFLYRQGDVDSLIKQLLKYAKDKELIVKHGQAARRRANEMMKGAHNADKLFPLLEKIVASHDRSRRPLNFARSWIDYPLVANQYIEESKILAFSRLFRQRVRGKLKSIYLSVTGLFDKEKDDVR